MVWARAFFGSRATVFSARLLGVVELPGHQQRLGRVQLRLGVIRQEVGGANELVPGQVVAPNSR